jgi:hypothetical protein
MSDIPFASAYSLITPSFHTEEYDWYRICIRIHI